MISSGTGASGPLRVEVVDRPEDAGAIAAALMLDAVVAAGEAGRAAVLGCPAGRTPRVAYEALGQQAAARGTDLSRVQIVMMDEFVVDTPDGVRLCPDDAHYSCRRAAELDLRTTVNDRLPATHRIERSAVHVPDPTDPGAYDARIEALGGIDLFLLASGASDGHVAFNPPDSSPVAGTHVVELAETTRRDNLATFPDFASIGEVPRRGVTVGLGTIARWSRQVVLLLIGPDKHESYRRVVGATAFDPAWPTTIVHRCAEARVVADRAAADRPGHQSRQ